MPATRRSARTEIPAISQPLLAIFQLIVRNYFRRSFHSVRLHGMRHLEGLSGPLLVYANHGSWWDPMIAFLLAGKLFPGRQHFAPMDAAALARYPVLGRLGIFPVEMRSARGAVSFLRTGSTILRSGAALWVTPQGQFADPRQRPLAFKPGLAALAARTPGCHVLPLAIEYPFWDERHPEALLQFGPPLQVNDTDTADTLEPQLIAALEATQDELRERVLTRSAAAFERTLSFHAAGTGGLYGLTQRLRALALRRPYQAEHTPTATPSNGTTTTP